MRALRRPVVLADEILSNMFSTHPYVPVLSSEEELKIPWQALTAMMGGRSLLDTSELYVESQQEAVEFLAAYGIDILTQSGQHTATEIMRDALVYLGEVLLPYRCIDSIPPEIQASNLEDMLIAASCWPHNSWPNWPCVVLKLCHAVAHTRWGYDTAAHQEAVKVIKTRAEKFLYKKHGTQWIGDAACAIPLVDFQFKVTKRFSRVMTKLLHKPGNLSSTIADHIGLRFVTYDLFSAILLIRFLRTRGVFMYANSNPGQARNSLVDAAKIVELLGPFNPDVKLVDLPTFTNMNQMTEAPDNPFSASEFKMIKLVERLLITLPDGRRTFFPYELQILDETTHRKSRQGNSNHGAYEKRQMQEVRRRVFGNDVSQGRS